mmetsp:Transcript_107199/g.149432  ORF Transcript_107199/g.149432 Transcript_107199/m.149432 type:complete len:269 (+) Transcript_107199:929-1735(+)
MDEGIQTGFQHVVQLCRGLQCRQQLGLLLQQEDNVRGLTQLWQLHVAENFGQALVEDFAQVRELTSTFLTLVCLNDALHCGGHLAQAHLGDAGQQRSVPELRRVLRLVGDVRRWHWRFQVETSRAGADGRVGGWAWGHRRRRSRGSGTHAGRWPGVGRRRPRRGAGPWALGELRRLGPGEAVGTRPLAALRRPRSVRGACGHSGPVRERRGETSPTPGWRRWRRRETHVGHGGHRGCQRHISSASMERGFCFRARNSCPAASSESGLS